MDKTSDLKDKIIKTLDLNKAHDIVSIDLKDKSYGWYMIIAMDSWCQSYWNSLIKIMDG